MERLSPSFHCPWLSVVAVLVVVGSIPPGDFCFIFWQICCFGLHTQQILVESKKMVVGGIYSQVVIGSPNAKSRAPGAGNRPFCVCRLGTRGRFGGRVGRSEPPHVT